MGGRVAAEAANLAVPGRLELPTFGLGNRCSIRLSYGTARDASSMFAPVDKPRQGDTIQHCRNRLLRQRQLNVCISFQWIFDTGARLGGSA